MPALVKINKLDTLRPIRGVCFKCAVISLFILDSKKKNAVARSNFSAQTTLKAFHTHTWCVSQSVWLSLADVKVCKSVFHLLLDKERPLLRLRSVQLGGVKVNAPFFPQHRFDMSQLEKVFQVTLQWLCWIQESQQVVTAWQSASRNNISSDGRMKSYEAFRLFLAYAKKRFKALNKQSVDVWIALKLQTALHNQHTSLIFKSPSTQTV